MNKRRRASASVETPSRSGVVTRSSMAPADGDDDPSHRDIELDDEEPPKGSFLMRFSVSHLQKVVAHNLNPKKEGHHKRVQLCLSDGHFTVQYSTRFDPLLSHEYRPKEADVQAS